MGSFDVDADVVDDDDDDVEDAEEEEDARLPSSRSHFLKSY